MDTNKIIELHSQGKTYKEIADELGYTQSAVSYNARKLKLKPNKARKLIDVDLLIKETSNGMSFSAYCRKYGHTLSAVSKIANKNGIKSPSKLHEKKDLPDQEILDRYYNNVSLDRLSKDYGVSVATIKRHINNIDKSIVFRSMDEAKRPSLLNNKDLLSDQMKIKSLRSIARELKVKTQTVINAVRRLGLSSLVRSQVITDNLEDIKILYDKGIGLTEIANAYGTYPTTIANIIRRIGGTIRKPGSISRDSKYNELNNKQWIEHQYHGCNKSMAFIAAYLGTTVGNVSNAIKKHGIKKKDKKQVYRELRRKTAIKTTISTKWGNWKLQSKAELKFVESIPDDAIDVKYEADTLSYNGIHYTPDFYVDGSYVEVKPFEYAVNPGVNRQRFVRQLMVARRNNADIKIWYNGKYGEYNDIDNSDIYYALNWKLFFDDSDECSDFIINNGFLHLRHNKDHLLCGLNYVHDIPEFQWLNANYPKSSLMDFIRHFNAHFWRSSHKEYNSVADAFSHGNYMVLRRTMRVLWEKSRNINIYGLCKLIAKLNKDFATVSIFKPWVAKYVYSKLLQNGGIVVDPCMGWGGRLLGTIGYDIQYLGRDLNQNSINAHIDMSKFVGSLLTYDPEFAQVDASECDWPDADLLFTSPPYDNTEFYYGLDNQCVDTTDIYNNIMRFKRIIALNVPIRHRDKCVDIAKKHGKRLVDEYKMKTKSFMGLRKNTYEPILIFK